MSESLSRSLEASYIEKANVAWIKHQTKGDMFRIKPKLGETKHGPYKYVIGIDEAGRGPLAGPVVAAACYVPEEVVLQGIIDSKATKEEDRENSYEEIVANTSILWGVSVVSNTEIDEINILQASLKAMRLATNELLDKAKAVNSDFNLSSYYALVDGNKIPSDMKVACEYVIKGDSLIYSIAAASIIAKVTRDRIMTDLSKIYPAYRLDKHKGYPTAEHRKILQELGPTPIHRLSYGPVKVAAERHSKSDANTSVEGTGTIPADETTSDADELESPKGPRKAAKAKSSSASTPSKLSDKIARKSKRTVDTTSIDDEAEGIRNSSDTRADGVTPTTTTPDGKSKRARINTNTKKSSAASKSKPSSQKRKSK